jgi:hypothetical protein
VGRLGIANPELTDGVATLRPRGWTAARRVFIGIAAPASGLPDLDWERNTGAIALDFGKKRRRP